MKTEDLIVELAARAVPVQRLPSTGRRLASWLVVALPAVVIITAAFGTRGDLNDAMTRVTFVAMLAAATLTSVMAGTAALHSSIPGRADNAARWTPPLLLVVWAVLTVALPSPAIAGAQSFPVHLICVLQIAAIGTLPAVALGVLVRRAAPLQPAWTGTLTALAAASIGAAGTQLVCPSDDPLHLLAGHVAIVGVAAIAGVAAAPIFRAFDGREPR